jgi:hypothetical protein
MTFSDPDEVWEDNPKARAKWTYVKEFASEKYQFSVALVAERPEQGYIIVPVSGFPCTRGDVKKWRKGSLLYSKNTTAAVRAASWLRSGDCTRNLFNCYFSLAVKACQANLGMPECPKPSDL